VKIFLGIVIVLLLPELPESLPLIGLIVGYLIETE
jgi:hypothetical protein